MLTFQMPLCNIKWNVLIHSHLLLSPPISFFRKKFKLLNSGQQKQVFIWATDTGSCFLEGTDSLFFFLNIFEKMSMKYPSLSNLVCQLFIRVKMAFCTYVASSAGNSNKRACVFSLACSRSARCVLPILPHRMLKRCVLMRQN